MKRPVDQILKNRPAPLYTGSQTLTLLETNSGDFVQKKEDHKVLFTRLYDYHIESACSSYPSLVILWFGSLALVLPCTSPVSAGRICNALDAIGVCARPPAGTGRSLR